MSSPAQDTSFRRSKTVLCVDDHRNALSGWALYLQTMGYNVVCASSGEEGLELFATRQVDAVVLDYSMPDVGGGEAATAMKRIKPQVPVILFTAYSEVPEPVKQTVDAFLVKGQAPDVLLKIMDQLLTRRFESRDLSG